MLAIFITSAVISTEASARGRTVPFVCKMKKLEISVVASVALIGFVAPTGSGYAQSCPYGQYENSDGDCVDRPDYGRSPRATAICRDGEESFSRHANGTCSGHGGVREWK
jgi:hypothetical protein